MDSIDRYAILRNTATLEAFRTRERKALQSAWPFTLTVAINAGLMPLLFIWTFQAHRLRDMALLFSAMIMVNGLAFAWGLMRMDRYRREHPWQPPTKS